MIEPQKKLNIKTLKQLREEKKRLQLQIEQSGVNISNIISDIPGKALGSTLGVIASAITKNLLKPSEKKEYSSTDTKEEENFSDKLVEVGEDTAKYALNKLVEKLFEK